MARHAPRPPRLQHRAPIDRLQTSNTEKTSSQPLTQRNAT
jgi:hypothetical protein